MMVKKNARGDGVRLCLLVGANVRHKLKLASKQNGRSFLIAFLTFDGRADGKYVAARGNGYAG